MMYRYIYPLIHQSQNIKNQTLNPYDGGMVQNSRKKRETKPNTRKNELKHARTLRILIETAI